MDCCGNHWNVHDIIYTYKHIPPHYPSHWLPASTWLPSSHVLTQTDIWNPQQCCLKSAWQPLKWSQKSHNPMRSLRHIFLRKVLWLWWGCDGSNHHYPFWHFFCNLLPLLSLVSQCRLYDPCYMAQSRIRYKDDIKLVRSKRSQFFNKNFAIRLLLQPNFSNLSTVDFLTRWQLPCHKWRLEAMV